MLRDRFGRNITYLRLSLTDACDLRCQYCMDEDSVFMHKSRLFSDDELERIIRLFFSLGIEKIRISGGEPLLRKSIFPRLLKIKKDFPNKRWSITTNLASKDLDVAMMHALFNEVNVSLDSIDPVVFTEITKRNKLSQVLANLEALKAQGVFLKINTVLIPERNEHQLMTLIDWASHQKIPIRFIEQMPFRNSENQGFISSSEVLDRVAAVYSFSPYTQLASGTAQYYQLDHNQGIFGLISAYSRSFCHSCNRIRVAANGDITTCLYGGPKANLLQILRNEQEEHKLVQAIEEAIANKEENGFVAEEENKNLQLMNVLGG